MWSVPTVWLNTSKLVPVSSTTTISLLWRFHLEALKCQVFYALHHHVFPNTTTNLMSKKKKKKVLGGTPLTSYLFPVLTRHRAGEWPGDNWTLLAVEDGVCGDGGCWQPLLGKASQQEVVEHWLSKVKWHITQGTHMLPLRVDWLLSEPSNSFSLPEPYLGVDYTKWPLKNVDDLADWLKTVANVKLGSQYYGMLFVFFAMLICSHNLCCVPFCRLAFIFMHKKNQIHLFIRIFIERPLKNKLKNTQIHIVCFKLYAAPITNVTLAALWVVKHANGLKWNNVMWDYDRWCSVLVKGGTVHLWLLCWLSFW